MLFLSFCFASIIFLLIDGLWLFLTIKSFYRPALNNLLLDKPIIWATVLFYIIYTIGLTIVILRPGLITNSFFEVFLNGFFFGLVAYGTYNLTNMATVKDWSPIVVFVDMIWGGILTSSVAFLTTYIIKTFFNS